MKTRANRFEHATIIRRVNLVADIPKNLLPKNEIVDAPKQEPMIQEQGDRILSPVEIVSCKQDTGSIISTAKESELENNVTNEMVTPSPELIEPSTAMDRFQPVELNKKPIARRLEFLFSI